VSPPFLQLLVPRETRCDDTRDDRRDTPPATTATTPATTAVARRPADPRRWITKVEAAKLTGKSTRWLERRIEAGEETVQQRTHGRGIVYLEDDVHQVARKLQQPDHVAPVEESTAVAERPSSELVQVLTVLAGLVAPGATTATTAATTPPPLENPCYTLAEAAALKRVSVAALRRIVEDGTLPAFKDRGGWRITRAHLEEL
jgi:excisionase family DNA binding protein